MQAYLINVLTEFKYFKFQKFQSDGLTWHNVTVSGSVQDGGISAALWYHDMLVL